MKNKKKFFITLLVLVFVLVVFFSLWYVYNEYGWSTYKNQEYSFQFDYPNRWGRVIQRKDSNLYLDRFIIGREAGEEDYRLLISLSNFSDIGKRVGDINISLIDTDECSVYYSTYYYIKDLWVISLELNPGIRLSQEECKSILTKVPNERNHITKFMGAVHSAAGLLESDIPAIHREDYNVFKEVLESFTVIE